MWHVLYRRICFSHETYGCTSWSSYIVVVISGFILSLLPFVSQFYWIAPYASSSPHVNLVISVYCFFIIIISLLISLVLSCVCTCSNTHRHNH